MQRIDSLSIPIFNDFHVHLRQGAMLRWMVKMLVRHGFRGYNLVMPNTKPACLTGEDALAYKKEILDALSSFRPWFDINEMQFIMSIQLTPRTTPQMIREAWQAGVKHVKIYPKDVTTNSEDGVEDYPSIYPCLREMENICRENVGNPKDMMYAHFHGEHPSSDVSGRRKADAFLDDKLLPIISEFTNLAIVLEHIPTLKTVQFIRFWHDNKRKIAGTITPQHAYLTEDDVVGYSRESHYKGSAHHLCKPMLQEPEHREAIQLAAVSGLPCFFFASDTAPHLNSAKYCFESSCGQFNTPVSYPVFASIFDKHKALSTEKLGYFGSHAGADFFGLPRIKGEVSLVRSFWSVPRHYQVPGIDHSKDRGTILLDHDAVTPMCAEREMEWLLVS